jgi:hypothetical protein
MYISLEEQSLSQAILTLQPFGCVLKALKQQGYSLSNKSLETPRRLGVVKEPR